MANILTNNYFTAGELRSMSNCLAQTSPTYTTVITGVALNSVIAIAGAIFKANPYITVPAKAINGCLTLTQSISNIDKANLKGLYDQCISIMSKCNYSEVKMSLYSSSAEGYYAATGLPKVTGYKTSSGSWILVN
ncbi:hypothetical protein [Clostridium sp.]|uniref:hypothetical protein n=1 Tax=Clostridium sp. TaxID=1506 RepID=UPI003217E061